MERDSQNLFSSMGNGPLVYITASLSLVMAIWCVLGANLWLRASRGASKSSCYIWYWLAAIFIMLSCRDAALSLMTVQPKIAIPLRLVALVVQNIAFPIFYYYARRHNFVAMGKYDSIGNSIVDAVLLKDLSEKDLASLARRLVIAASLDTRRDARNTLTPEQSEQCGIAV